MILSPTNCIVKLYSLTWNSIQNIHAYRTHFSLWFIGKQDNQEVLISYNYFFKAKSEFLTYSYKNSVCKARSPFLFCLEITFKPEFLPAIHLILFLVLKAYTHTSTNMQRTYLSSEFLML